MRQFFVWKLFDRVLAPFEQSYIELVAFLALCALATAALAIRRGRQTWRFIVQLVSLIVFFFVVSSCLGVFGLIRNAIMGLGLLAAQDDLSAFFWMNMTLVALGAAFVGGAVFCGWICPTGALQEWAGWLARRLGLTPNNNAKMRTGALAVWVAVVAAYLVVAYAVFGKRRPILEDSATLWAGALSVLVAMVLLAPRHSPALKRFRAVSLLLILGFTVAGISVFSPVHFIFMNVQDRASMLSALAIVGAGFFVLRAWCRYLCPFGLVCGWAARHAVFQIAKGETCARCGTCERVCEMEAVHTGKVCVSDCIACMKCVDHCPEQALSLVARPFGDTKEAAPNGRTAAISAMVARSALVLFFACWTAAPASGASVEVLWNGFRGGPDAIAWRECGNAGTSEPCATWTFRPSNVTWNYSPGQTMWSSPAVAEIGNRVVCFVGCYDHNVYAIDVATGREVWRYPTGNGVYSTPAIVRVDGRDCLLVSSSDRTLYCLDAQKGTKIWAYEVYEWRQSLGRAFLASPIIVTASDGPSVILVSWAYDTAPKRVNEVAEIRALSPQDGRLRWKRIFAENRPTHPVAGLIGGGPRIYVGASDGNLYCLDGNDGSEVWRGAFKFPVEGAPAWVAGRDDGPPPLVLVGSRFGDLRAFDAASGETVWTFKTGGWILATPAVVSASDGKTVAVFGSCDGRVYCLEARTGRMRWRYSTRGSVVASAAIVPHLGNTKAGAASGEFDVIVPSDDDVLHRIAGHSGRGLWQFSPGPFLWAYRGLGETIWESPAAVRIGNVEMLIVPFYDGRVHGYRLDRRDEWLPQLSSPAYGRTMLARIAASMIATLALGLIFVWQRRRSAAASESLTSLHRSI